MQLEEVKQRVVAIKALKEKAATPQSIATAHTKQDELWAEVLQDVVRGNWTADHLAMEALKLLEV